MLNNKPYLSKTQNICLVLLWILFILLGFIMVREIISKKHQKQDNLEKISLDDEALVNAMSAWSLDYQDSLDELIPKVYSKNFKVEDLNLSEKIYISLIKEDIPACDSDTLLTFSIAKLNEVISETFLNTKVTKEDLENIIDPSNLGGVYNLTYDGKEISFLKKCKVNNSNKLLTKVVDAKKSDTELLVSVQVSFRKTLVNSDGQIVYIYYKNPNMKSSIESVGKVDADKITWDKYDTFTYQFKIVNNNYYLQSIT